jgi:predicted phage terminase large subunit-like protein
MAGVVGKQDAVAELQFRRRARVSLHEYIVFTSGGRYVKSYFSETVCSALDRFIDDVRSAKRPILILSAPPQHGKTEIVSRKLPCYLMSKFPELRIAAASYNSKYATGIGLDVRRNLASPLHQILFPVSGEKRKYTVNRMGEFNSPYGSGSYIGDGIGGGFTGKSADVFIIDDPIKNAEEALSEVTKESIWQWYQSTSKTRMSENSGLIVMATRWAEDDLSARIEGMLPLGSNRLTHLRFPAINSPGETGYDPRLPEGALIPQLHSLTQLLEFKNENSDYWWSSQYQQSPKPIGGNVFKTTGIRYYLPKDLPRSFDKVIDSWDMTFKNTDGTDYVAGGKWGKKGANAYLLIQVHKQMGFTESAEKVKWLRNQEPISREILIEDKANGPAVIDFLKKEVFGIIAVEPDGSKLARAHATTSVWEAGNVWLPHPDIAPWVVDFVNEITRFPAAAHDDWVDMMTQALRRLYPLFGTLKTSAAAVAAATGQLRR